MSNYARGPVMSIAMEALYGQRYVYMPILRDEYYAGIHPEPGQDVYVTSFNLSHSDVIDAATGDFVGTVGNQSLRPAPECYEWIDRNVE